MDLLIYFLSTKASGLCSAFGSLEAGKTMAGKRTLPLETLKTFVATPMELVALGDAIHHYLDAAQRGQLPRDLHKEVVPLLESFQARLVQQLEGSTSNDGI